MPQKDHAAVDSLAPLFNGKDRNTPLFLLGAGASWPQVPLARDACEQLVKRVLRENRSPVTNPADWLRDQPWFKDMPPGTDLGAAFPYVVQNLLQPRERRRRLLREMLHQSVEPNQGYAALAQLIAARKSRTVLTTNFDYCIFKALLAFDHTIGRPLEIRSPGDCEMMDDEAPCQIVYLHGTLDNYSDLNTKEEIHKLDPGLLSKIWPYLDQAPLIVLGYGGAEQSIMRSLLRQGCKHTGRFRCGLFWCTLAQADLHENVKELSEAIGSNMQIIEIDGFQGTMIGLTEALRRKFPADFVESHDSIADAILDEIREGRPHVTVQRPIAPSSGRPSAQLALRLQKLQAAQATFPTKLLDRYLRELLAESKEGERNYAAANAIFLADLWKSRLPSVSDAAILGANFRLDPYPNLDLSGCKLDQCAFFDALAPVNTVAVSSKLRIFAAADAEGDLHVWDFEGRKVARQKVSREAVWTVAIGEKDRDLILTAGADGFLRTWSISEGALQDQSTVNVSPQGLAAAAVTHDSVFAGGTDGILRVHTLSGDRIGSERWAKRLTDGHIHAIAATNEWIAAGDSLGRVHVLRVGPDRNPISISELPFQHASAVHRLAFSADQRFLSAARQDGTLHIWRLSAQADGFSLIHEGRPTDMAKRHSCLAWLDERTLLTGHHDGTVSEYSMEANGADIRKLTPCHDGTLLAIHAATGSSPSFVTAGSDYRVRLHQQARTEHDAAGPSIHGYCDWQNHGLIVRIDSELAILSGGEAGKLWSWRREEVTLPTLAASVSGAITALACSERLKLLVVGCASGFVYMFRFVDSGVQSGVQLELQSNLQLDHRILSAAFPRDEVLILTADRVICMDTTLHQTWEHPRRSTDWHGQMELHHAGDTDVALVPDGQTVIRFSFGDKNAPERDDLTCPSTVRAIAASAGGTIACGHDDGALTLFRDGHSERLECGNDMGQINGLAFFGRTETLCLIGRGGNVWLMDASHPALPAKGLDLKQVFHYLSGHRDSNSVFLGGMGSSVHLVDVHENGTIGNSSRTVPLPYFGWSFARAGGLSALQVEELKRLGAKVQP